MACTGTFKFTADSFISYIINSTGGSHNTFGSADFLAGIRFPTPAAVSGNGQLREAVCAGLPFFHGEGTAYWTYDTS
jgi:hypothetical protein